MKNSKIEWCDHTVNFWWGCVFALLSDGSLSEECRNCYAHLLSKLFSRGKATWGVNGNRWIRHEAARRELYKIDKSAHERGVRERVFINSMSDTFEDRADLEQARCMLWGACVFVTNVDIILLTKRPQNAMRMVPPSWHTNWPAHVWIGTTCGTQQAAEERIPALLSIPAKVRFLSCEPMLGSVDIAGAIWNNCAKEVIWPYMATVDKSTMSAPLLPGIQWVICGGESGPKARPMHPEWARSLRDQCMAAGVPFFFKQWGEWSPAKPAAGISSIALGLHGSDVRLQRLGKHNTGRLLDGVEHSSFPANTQPSNSGDGATK
jgi:protein gp37